METIAKCLKEVFYKGHHITKVEDVFGQVAVRIDNVVEPGYASIADAKRVINGKAPKWFTDGYMWDEASKKVVKDPNAFRWEE
jgi:hypothetical protein